MQSGKIKDSQISASSSYDVSVTGPSSARLNVERAGGAWCPREMVGQEDLKEYLEIDLESPHVISFTESQGRFGNGQGVEFVEQYMLEYWRPGHNTWYTYKKWNGDKVRSSRRQASSERISLPASVPCARYSESTVFSGV
nr:discoidin domain-containing receptor A-like [Penaeus vannamei]